MPWMSRLYEMNFCVYNPSRLWYFFRALEQTMTWCSRGSYIEKDSQGQNQRAPFRSLNLLLFFFFIHSVILKHFLLSKANCVQLETFIQAERKRKHLWILDVTENSLLFILSKFLSRQSGHTLFSYATNEVTQDGTEQPFCKGLSHWTTFHEGK